MELLKKIEAGTKPKGLFLCSGCGQEVITHYYSGKRAKVCKNCKYEEREVRPNKCATAKHEHIRDYGYESPLYAVWKAVRARCHNPKSTGYHKYGAKGITMCNEWRESFFTFAEWMLDNGYDPSLSEGEYKHRHSIDRIDDGKGYSPDNCQILTVSENSIKRNDNKRIAVHAYRAIDGSYVGSYASLMEAARSLKVQVNHMTELLDSKATRNQANGYMFSIDKVDKMEVPKGTRVTAPFEAFDKDDNSIGIYKTKKEFAEKYDVAVTNISKVLNGKRKHTKGFTFKYL